MKRAVLAVLLVAAALVIVWRARQSANNNSRAAGPLAPWTDLVENRLPAQPATVAPTPGRGQSPARSAAADLSGPEPLALWSRGTEIVLALPGRGGARGRVNLVLHESNGVTRAGGELLDRAGSFSLTAIGSILSGRILLTQERIGYEVSAQPNGQILLAERPLNDMLCFWLPALIDPLPAPSVPDVQAAPPLLSSRPEAAAVLYLDFDGETVTDPDWNGGNTIVAAPSTLTSAQITEVWERVKEDYAAFDIDVTTDPNRYAAALVGRRMRCIITPTKAWFGPAGGVAYLNSFRQAGTNGFTANVPCWVFNSSVIGIAEAISHEAGHTFGLRHDGRTNPVEEYYAGHGTGEVGWAPIMGVGYYQPVVQWSKGEYANASNLEDDVAIIAGAVNGFGLVADDAGNDRTTATTLANVTSGISGLISPGGDGDFFSFTLTGPKGASLLVVPARVSPNVDLRVELQDSSGAILAASNPDQALHASLALALPAGTYYAKVQGTGRGNVLSDGYSAYGSFGTYSFSVLLTDPPIIQTAPVSQSVDPGGNVTFSVLASGNGALGYRWRKNGVELVDGGRFSGSATPVLTISGADRSDAGEYTVAITGAGGTAISTPVTLAINDIPTTTTALRTRIAVVGQPVEFEIKVVSSDAATYAWSHNGTPIAGAVTARLQIASAVRSDRGWYEVAVTNSHGTVRSRCRLEVVAPNNTVLSWEGETAQAAIPVGLRNIVALAAGGGHRLALQANGTVVAWGSNGDGQSNVPSSLKNVVAISAGESHSLALTSDGKVVAWGSNAWGQINVPAQLTDVIAISAGFRHSVVLRADGSIVVWGGFGDSGMPAPAGLTDAVDVAGGMAHNLAIRANGTVVGWGGNFSGELNIPPGLSGVVAVATSDAMTLALKSNGTVVAWGSQLSQGSQYNVPAGLTSVEAVSLGVTYNLALKTDGTLVAWGGNFYGLPITPIPAEAVNVSALASSSPYMALVPVVGVALVTHPSGDVVAPGAMVEFKVVASGTPKFGYQWKRNGVALANGGNVSGATSAKLTITNAQLADSGAYTVLVTNAGGDVTSNPAALTVAVPPTITNRPLSRLASVGEALSFSVTAAGAAPLAYHWKHDGRIVAGVSGPTLTIPSATVADSGWYQVTVLGANGGRATSVFYLTVSSRPTAGPNAVVSWGYNFFAQANVPVGLGNVVALAGGSGHSLALKADGTVVVWGSGTSGSTPAPAGLSEVVAITAGGNNNLALKADGTVVAWGSNPNGETEIPATVRDVVAIGGGGVVALKGDGTVIAWGFGSAANPVTGIAGVAAGLGSALGVTLEGTVVPLVENTAVPAGLSKMSRLATGSSHNVGLKTDGTIATWGALAMSVPEDLDDVVGIAAGASHAYALKTDGRIVGMGSDFFGQVSGATAWEDVIQVAAGGDHGLALVKAKAISLTVPLTNISVTTGQSATLGATINGTPPFTYQWSRNGIDIPGATFATHVISGAQESDNGTYVLAVTNPVGTVTSDPAVLTVTGPPTAPLIRSQSQSMAVMSDAAQVLSVSAAGSMPLSYQWYEGEPGDVGTPVTGAIGPSLEVSPVGGVRTHWLRITNPAGTRDSAGILLVPWQTRDAGSGTAHLAGAGYANGRYYVARSEGGAFSTDGVAWTSFSAGGFTTGFQSRVTYGNGIYVAGGGSASSNLYSSSDGTSWTSRASAQDAGIIARVVFNGTSFVAVGTRGQISSSVDGITWTLRDSSSNIDLVDVAYGSGRFVAVGALGRVVTSTNGTTWSEESPPMNQSFMALAFGRGRFVALVGPGFMSNRYQIWSSEDGTLWTQRTVPLLNGAELPIGAGNDIAFGGGVFVIAAGKNLLLSEDGISWSVTANFFPRQTIQRNSLAYGNGRFLAAGQDGSVLQSLPVAPAARISNATPTHFVTSGQATQLAVAAEGPGLTYQWYRGTSGNPSEPIAGAMGPLYTTSAATQAQAYWVRVANDCGSVDSATILVGIAAPPLPGITTAPAPQSVYAGASVTFGVTASSATALSYQWRKNGVDIPGATSATFTIGSTQAADAASYSVFVRNDAGVVASSLAVLAVVPLEAPQITRQPQSQASVVGQAVMFRVTATGSPGPNYQWRKGGEPIVGATGPTYAITSVQPADTGDYAVFVSNSVGSVLSNLATLTLVAPGTSASHELAGFGYLPGGTITINNTFVHPGASGLEWHVLLPAGWSFAGDAGDAGPTKPVVGQGDLIEWHWSSPPPSPVSFSYTLNVPATQAGPAELVALAGWQDGALLQTVAKPDPLVVLPVRHSADTNGNDKIDVEELSRVITLYNARFITVDGRIRTGAYSAATSSTVDGFTPDSTREKNAPVTLARYHSADYNHNGQIDVEELSRVITLYNTRFTIPDGKIRTGFYKLALGAHLDGFAPDPSRDQ